MKLIGLITFVSLISGCLMTSPEPAANYSYRAGNEDIENLQSLLLNDQAFIYENEQNRSSNDIQLGMPKSRVERTLGYPQEIQVAGNPKYENEKWVYVRRVPTLHGEFTEEKVMYFEGGRLVGWENR